jgi:hypothetical protein
LGSTNLDEGGAMLISVIYLSLSLLWPAITLEATPKAEPSVFHTYLTFVPYEQRRLELDFGVPSTLKRRSRKEIFLSWMAQVKSN